jgi:hypothetical protein
MGKERCSVAEWTEMFEAVGLDESKRHAWHFEFERRHPAAHEGFLAWLGLPADEITRIRVASRSKSAG